MVSEACLIRIIAISFALILINLTAHLGIDYYIIDSNNYEIKRKQSAIVDTSKCTLSHCINQAPMETKTKLFNFLYHTKTTYFIHPSIQMHLYADPKGFGLKTNQAIKAGNILFIEYPLIKINHETDPNIDIVTMMHEIHRTVNEDRIEDEEFSQVWDSLGMNHKMYMHHLKAILHLGVKDIVENELDARLVDLIKVKTNQFGSGNKKWRKPWAVYGILSKINYGLPQNIAVIFGGAEHEFVCVAFAVKDIKKGDELVSDYFFDWTDFGKNKISEALEQRRANVGSFFGYNHSDKMKKIINALRSDKMSQKKKYKILERFVYPNGIIGKRSDQNKLEMVQGGEENNMVMNNMQTLVNSGQLFQIIEGNVSSQIASWMGRPFTEHATGWKGYRLINTWSKSSL